LETQEIYESAEDSKVGPVYLGEEFISHALILKTNLYK